MTSSSSVLNSGTVVLGFFDGAEVSFTIGDCQRKESRIKAYNIKRIDEEENPVVVPTTLCVSDARLTLSSHSKTEIFGYFNSTTTAIDEPTPKTKEVKKPKKEEIRKVHTARR